MRRINTLLFLDGLSDFKIITDEFNVEYVVFSNSVLTSVTGINDRTGFEATENHIHILDDISTSEFTKLFPIARSLGNMLLCCLKQRFPDKKFVVFVSLSVKDSFIIRFHQKWENEMPYYDLNDFTDSKDKIFMFET